MPRILLTPEEKAARRKARSAFTFSDAAYRHYDPERDGYGSPDEWETIARKMFGVTSLAGNGADKWLTLLGLTELPRTLDGLKKAFRAEMFRSHPDYGGTNAKCRAVMEAFATLKHKFSEEVTQ